MTETSHCLDSHPKFLCTIGASIFSLQSWYPTYISMKQEISKAVQSLSAVSCRISCRLFHESGTPKDHLTFRQVQSAVLSLWVLCVQFMHQFRQEKFLAQMVIKLHKEPLHCPSSSWNRLVLPGADVSHCHENPSY